MTSQTSVRTCTTDNCCCLHRSTRDSSLWTMNRHWYNCNLNSNQHYRNKDKGGGGSVGSWRSNRNNMVVLDGMPSFRILLLINYSSLALTMVICIRWHQRDAGWTVVVERFGDSENCDYTKPKKQAVIRWLMHHFMILRPEKFCSDVATK